VIEPSARLRHEQSKVPSAIRMRFSNDSLASARRAYSGSSGGSA